MRMFLVEFIELLESSSSPHRPNTLLLAPLRDFDHSHSYLPCPASSPRPRNPSNSLHTTSSPIALSRECKQARSSASAVVVLEASPPGDGAVVADGAAGDTLAGAEFLAFDVCAGGNSGGFYVGQAVELGGRGRGEGEEGCDCETHDADDGPAGNVFWC